MKIEFSGLAGNWSGSVRTWLDPNAEPVLNEMTGTFRLAPGGKSVIHDYESAVGENESNGSMMIGTNIETGRLCLAWIDSFHTGGGVMLFDSEGDAFLGSYAAGTEMWRWRITFALSGHELHIDHVNISPAGVEERAISTRYKRRATSTS